MLALSRFVDESIIIRVPGFPPIEVKVIRIVGNKVHLGFDAAPAIIVNRKEIDDEIQEIGHR